MPNRSDGNLDIQRDKRKLVNCVGQFGQQAGTAIILENKYGVIVGVGAQRDVFRRRHGFQYFRTGEILGRNNIY